MTYIIIALLVVALISLSVAVFLELRKIKISSETAINDLQNKLLKAVEEREAKIGETIRLLSNIDKFIVQYFSIPMLDEKLKELEYPETLDFEVLFPLNEYYEGQKMKTSNGTEYTIIKTGKQIKVEKSLN